MEVLDIVKTCPMCNGTTTVRVRAHLYEAWQNRLLHVQEAFPELDADMREVLMTGIDPTCWDSMWPDEEED
jgi:hypothetical protein